MPPRKWNDYMHWRWMILQDSSGKKSLTQFTNSQQCDSCWDWQFCIFDVRVKFLGIILIFFLLLLKIRNKRLVTKIFFFLAEEKNKFLLTQLTVYFRVKKKREGGEYLKNNLSSFLKDLYSISLQILTFKSRSHCLPSLFNV